MDFILFFCPFWKATAEQRTKRRKTLLYFVLFDKPAQSWFDLSDRAKKGPNQKEQTKSLSTPKNKAPSPRPFAL
jgi:hypothetical protein